MKKALMIRYLCKSFKMSNISLNISLTSCKYHSGIFITPVRRLHQGEKEDFSKEAHTRKPRKIIYDKKKSFIDWKRVRVKAGDGGSGVATFVHSRDHRGGPNGGDGGKGGSVVFTANKNLTQLAHLKHHYRAQKGSNGSQKNRHGKNATDLFLQVPVGTTITKIHADDEVSYFDVVHPDEHFVIAKGGKKGLGNVHFKSPANVRPYEFTEGGAGEECVVELELKSIADVGLVGYPNAGKSTLLQSISHAKPKIGDYPFTTLRPNIGVVQYNDGLNISVADIPGLIAGAHLNKGLGHLFLRHIERCRCLLFVVDVSNKDTALEQLQSLKLELEMYKTDLLSLHSAVVANKIDLINNEDEVIENVQKNIDMSVIGVSAKFSKNIEALKNLIRHFFIV